jgi:TRAP-type C4-dicarboxylate transport system substrate-binding protein
MAAETQTFTVVSGLPAEHAAVKVFRKHFREAVKAHFAEADDTIEIKWRPGYDGTIARHGDVLEAVSDGVGDIGIVAVDYENTRLPVQNIGFHLPFATEQCAIAAGAYHALHTGIAEMNRPWQEAGQIYLANLTTDGFGLFTNKKVSSVEDLRGLMVGVSVRIEHWLTGIAATPFRVPRNRLDGAMESEAIDGAIMPATEINRLELGRWMPNLLLAEFGAQPAYAITINEQRFVSLPPALRSALLDAADAFVPEGADAYCAAGETALDALKKDGVRPHLFYNSRREAWVSALPPLGQIWASAREADGYPGPQLVATYMEYIREAGANPKRDWDLEQPPTN